MTTLADFPAPPVTDLTKPYWDGLAAGELRFQRCQSCGHAWLPPREECPQCLLPDWRFEVSAGTGMLISWVVYHRAFHAYFADKVPYYVAVVELTEGPRLITNLVFDDEESKQQLRIDQRVRLRISSEAGWSLARFGPA